MQDIQLIFMNDIRHYKRVSCDFYDHLLNHVLQKQKLILHLDIEDRPTLQGVIEDVFTKEGEEFCIVGNHTIRLDLIKDITTVHENL